MGLFLLLYFLLLYSSCFFLSNVHRCASNIADNAARVNSFLISTYTETTSVLILTKKIVDSQRQAR